MTVAACVLLLLPLVDKYANPWAALVGGAVGMGAGFVASRRAGRDRLMPDKYTELTPELYAYVVEHGARQDDVLRRLAAETERELEDVASCRSAPTRARS